MVQPLGAGCGNIILCRRKVDHSALDRSILTLGMNNVVTGKRLYFLDIMHVYFLDITCTLLMCTLLIYSLFLFAALFLVL